MSEWISVENKLPAMGQECLIRIPVSNYHNIESGRHKSHGIWTGAWCNSRGAGCSYKVSHWMPRPNEPLE